MCRADFPGRLCGWRDLKQQDYSARCVGPTRKMGCLKSVRPLARAGALCIPSVAYVIWDGEFAQRRHTSRDPWTKKLTETTDYQPSARLRSTTRWPDDVREAAWPRKQTVPAPPARSRAGTRRLRPLCAGWEWTLIATPIGRLAVRNGTPLAPYASHSSDPPPDVLHLLAPQETIMVQSKLRNQDRIGTGGGRGLGRNRDISCKNFVASHLS